MLGASQKRLHGATVPVWHEDMVPQDLRYSRDTTPVRSGKLANQWWSKNARDQGSEFEGQIPSCSGRFHGYSIEDIEGLKRFEEIWRVQSMFYGMFYPSEFLESFDFHESLDRNFRFCSPVESIESHERFRFEMFPGKVPFRKEDLVFDSLNGMLECSKQKEKPKSFKTWSCSVLDEVLSFGDSLTLQLNHVTKHPTRAGDLGWLACCPWIWRGEWWS